MKKYARFEDKAYLNNILRECVHKTWQIMYEKPESVVNRINNLIKNIKQQ